MMGTTDERERVLICYGEVMCVVQDWEQALAIVWWRTTRKDPDRATGDYDTQGSQKEVRRFEAAFLRMSAQEQRGAVAPHLDSHTAVGLKGLMGDRNRLVHRFLSEQGTGGSDFKPGTHDQLIEFGNRFFASLESIMQTISRFERYKGPVAEHWEAVAERIVDRVFNGVKVPRDPQQQ